MHNDAFFYTKTADNIFQKSTKNIDAGGVSK